METAALVASISGAIELLKWGIPEIQKRVQAGEISPEYQQTILDAVNALRDKGNAEYTGPENELSGR